MRPVVRGVAHLNVPLPAIFQPFGGNRIQLCVGGVHQRDGRRGRRVVLLRQRFDFDEVEVVAAVLNLLGAFQHAITARGEGDARRQRERLLRGGQREVDAPLVGAELRAETADRVHEQQRVVVLAHDLRDRGSGW